MRKGFLRRGYIVNNGFTAVDRLANTGTPIWRCATIVVDSPFWKDKVCA